MTPLQFAKFARRHGYAGAGERFAKPFDRGTLELEWRDGTVWFRRVVGARVEALSVVR